jgi:hypothetical protein
MAERTLAMAFGASVLAAGAGAARAAAAHDTARAPEIHMLTGAGTAMLAGAALVSLARHWSVPVVLHDDGTLRARDRALLARVSGGAPIISAADADERTADALAATPRLARARRTNLRLRQLVDYHLLARTERIVGMDADVVLLRSPEAIRTWAETAGSVPMRYSPERTPKGPHWVPRLFPGEPFLPDLCCGFVATTPGSFLDLEAAEHFVARTPRDLLDGKRFVTQMLYSLLAAREPSGVASLGPDYESGRLRWLEQRPGRVLCHYFASHRRTSWRESVVEDRAVLSRALGEPALFAHAIARHERVRPPRARVLRWR